MRLLILYACVLQTAFAAPQIPFLTFENGQVGVNFMGYHASAGLGGFLSPNGGTGGGLSASAGTPFGQRAAAGLGGNVGSRTSGFLYANAQAAPRVAAGAGLHGSTDGNGYVGGATTSHKVVHKTDGTSSKTKVVQKIDNHDHHHHHRKQLLHNTIVSNDNADVVVTTATPTLATNLAATTTATLAIINNNAGDDAQPDETAIANNKHSNNKQQQQHIGQNTSVIIVKRQRIGKHHGRRHSSRPNRIRIKTVNKTLTASSDESNSIESAEKDVYWRSPPPPPPPPQVLIVPQSKPHSQQSESSVTTTTIGGPNVVHHALNIPIGILRSLQESLGGFRVDKTISHHKTISTNVDA